jgi:hypothetical protein
VLKSPPHLAAEAGAASVTTTKSAEISLSMDGPWLPPIDPYTVMAGLVPLHLCHPRLFFLSLPGLTRQSLMNCNSKNP